MSTDVLTLPLVASGGGGRPPLIHDNTRVRAVLTAWCGYSAPEEVADDEEGTDGSGSRWMDDILMGVSWLQSKGQNSTRPLNKTLILRVLLHCDSITSEEVGRTIGRDHCRSQADRYTAAARVASKAIEAELDRRPEWVRQVLDDAASMAELDAMG